VNDEEELRRKMFPFSRMARNLSFPNVDLKSFLSSIHCQRTTAGEILHHVTLDPYIVLVDSETKVSLWSCEMMVHRMI
jgi:hypothetical protein